MAAIHEFIQRHKGLVWSTQHYDDLSEEFIVESVLNYGDWHDVQEVVEILGMHRIADIFYQQIAFPRNNYRPEIIDYFSRYFQKHA